jgi:uncharacterized membrane protein
VFDSIGDMPLHPLVVHAVVVGAPLAALLGFMFVIPRFRAWARWPLAVVAVGTFASAIVAKESGEGLQHALGLSPSTPTVGPLFAQHSMLATQLVVILAAYGVLAVLNALVVTRRTGIVRVVDRILPLVLALVGIVVLVWVYRVGDVGSRMVWNPAGTQTY